MCLTLRFTTKCVFRLSLYYNERNFVPSFSGQHVGPIFKGQAVRVERRPQIYWGKSVISRKCTTKIEIEIPTVIQLRVKRYLVCVR